MHLNHSLLFLKSPLVFNGDSIPPRRLTQPECALTAAALHPSLLSFILFLCPPIPSSVFYLLSLLTISSLHLFLRFFFCFFLSPLSRTTTFLLTGRTPEPERAAPVQTGVCWAEAEGFSFFFFFSFYFYFKCAGWTQEGGEAAPGTTWPMFIENMRRFRNWSPASAFPQLFICCCFWIFFKIATSGMLNKDWWMFPNCVSLTLSATTTSRCFFIQIPFFPSWLAHLNFSVSL